MSDFIEARDPRGVKITCSKSQWENHIIASGTGHTIMKDNVKAIIETIEEPDYIFESHDSKPSLDYREVYSKETKGATYYSNAPYTKVVVVTIGGSGEIITAYPAKNPTGGTKGDAIYRANHED